MRRDCCSNNISGISHEWLLFKHYLSFNWEWISSEQYLIFQLRVIYPNNIRSDWVQKNLICIFSKFCMLKESLSNWSRIRRRSLQMNWYKKHKSYFPLISFILICYQNCTNQKENFLQSTFLKRFLRLQMNWYKKHKSYFPLVFHIVCCQNCTNQKENLLQTTFLKSFLQFLSQRRFAHN